MPGKLGTQQALRGSVRGFVLIGVALALVNSAAGAAEGPAARLMAHDPEAFPAGTLVDALGGGESGANVLLLTPRAAAWGLKEGDVVLRVEGEPLGSATWNSAAAVPPAGAAAPTLTVWRAATGARQVQSPAETGSVVLEEFVGLPESERTPMRLAVMLANRGTLAAAGGGGVALVPADSVFDNARWLRCANPLPPEGESALKGIAKALRKRTRMELAPGNDDIAAGARELERGKPFEARERAQRGLLAQVREPERRQEPGQLPEGVRVYTEAQLELVRRQAARKLPEPFFAIVAEGNASFVQDFLPQQSLMNVQQSWGWGAQGGARVRLSPAGVPFFSRLFLLAQIGYYSNEFDDLAGDPHFRTQLTQFSAEVMYRPVVSGSLRPYLRGGAGLYSFTGKAHCPGGQSDWSTVVDRWEFGAIFGGGMDVLHIRSLHMNIGLNATYRMLHSKFGNESEDYYSMLDCARNVAADVELEKGYFNLDLDGVQLGVLFTFVP